MRQTEQEHESSRRLIRSEIRTCEQRIEDCNGQIVKLNEKIEEQKRLEQNYAAMRSEIENIKARKRSKVSITEVYQGNVKFLFGYSARIYDFLDGQRAVRAGEYMEDVTTRMWHEIDSNQQSVEELQSQIAGCNHQINTLERRLRGI